MTQVVWPKLPLAAWKDTYATLHLWTQIVGKIRLVQTQSLLACRALCVGARLDHLPDTLRR
jgi:hypothetical protein